MNKCIINSGFTQICMRGQNLDVGSGSWLSLIWLSCIHNLEFTHETPQVKVINCTCVLLLIGMKTNHQRLGVTE